LCKLAGINNHLSSWGVYMISAFFSGMDDLLQPLSYLILKHNSGVNIIEHKLIGSRFRVQGL